MTVSLPLITVNKFRQNWLSTRDAWQENGKFAENKKTFKSKPHVLLLHAHLQFSNIIRYGSCTDCHQRLLTAFRWFSYSFCVTYLPISHLFSAWSRICFITNNFFSKLNKEFFQGQVNVPVSPGWGWKCDLDRNGSGYWSCFLKKVTWAGLSKQLKALGFCNFLRNQPTMLCFNHFAMIETYIYLYWSKYSPQWGYKQGIDQQIYIRKSISRIIMHPQCSFK